ncbi:MAG TPA: ester cyclase [Chloroflexota bacterium]
MTSEDTKNIARRYLDGFNGTDLSRVEEFIAEDCSFHGPGTPPGLTGPEGYRQIVEVYRRAFPDEHISVDEQIAEGEKVATSWHAEGTHRGELFGIQPTNKHGRTTAMHFFTVRGGKIRDAQIEWDMMGLMQQLGVVPMPGQGERRAA